MGTIHVDLEASDDERRARLYGGAILVFTPRASTRALAAFARAMLEEAFAPHDPPVAQYALPVERYAEILAELKPRFIHHPESKRLIQAVLDEFGCDAQKTYFDVPRLRSSTSDGYLTTGIAYAFHPHRDTWYSAPACQLNWWLPIYPLAENGMAFHPGYWSEPVKNGSRTYNYAEWNKTSRFDAAKHIGKDTRVQPHPEEPVETRSQVQVSCDVGGLILFSGAQLHSSVENQSGQTRFSVDFRTVHLDELIARSGAPNVDSECTGTTMADYLRRSDLAHVPQELVRAYDTPPHPRGA